MQTTRKKVITRVLGLTYAPCIYTNNPDLYREENEHVLVGGVFEGLAYINKGYREVPRYKLA